MNSRRTNIISVISVSVCILNKRVISAEMTGACRGRRVAVTCTVDRSRGLSRAYFTESENHNCHLFCHTTAGFSLHKTGRRIRAFSAGFFPRKKTQKAGFPVKTGRLEGLYNIIIMKDCERGCGFRLILGAFLCACLLYKRG